MTRFWRNWLTIWGGLLALLGLALAGAGLEATSGPARLILGLLQGGSPPELDDQMRFAMAGMGAVTFGWALTLLAAFEAAHQLGAAGGPTWRRLVAIMLVWWLLDSGLSIATGLGLNAVANSLLVAALLLPLLASGVLRRA